MYIPLNTSNAEPDNSAFNLKEKEEEENNLIEVQRVGDEILIEGTEVSQCWKQHPPMSPVLENGNMLYLYIMSSALLFLFSTIHHTFSCHSNDVWNCCYKLDLTGIMFQLISATISSVHFMFHDFETIRRNYMIIFITIGIITIIFSLFDFFISAKLNMFVMLLYAFLFMLFFMISLHWILIANIAEIEGVAKFILIGFLFTFIGFVVFLAKFPECFIQNKTVDLFCQSHTIWHLCCVGGIVFHYISLYYYNDLLHAKGK